MTIFWISGDNILWCPTDHRCLLWFMCSRYGSVMKNKKRSSDLASTTKGHASKSQKTQPSYIFPSKYTKNHMTEIFWKTSIDINRFGSNYHVICQASRDTVDQSLEFFYRCKYCMVPKSQNFFKYRKMFFQVILEIKTNFHVISPQNGYIH